MPKVTYSYKLQFRRRREGRTDYNKRFGLLKSGRTRAVVRKSLDNMTVQFVNYDASGDKIAVSASTSELKKYGWTSGTGNVPASYLVGMLAGMKAKKAGITEAILDMGTQINTKGSRIFAALKGMVDAGVKIAHSPEVLPSDDRVSGKHIADHVHNAVIVQQFGQAKEKIAGA